MNVTSPRLKSLDTEKAKSNTEGTIRPFISMSGASDVLSMFYNKAIIIAWKVRYILFS